MTKLYRPVGQKTLWPVGSVFLTVTKTNPSTWFGGTWVQMYGGYLYAAESSTGQTSYTGSGTQSKAAFTSGGPSTNTSGSTAITVKQMPAHAHSIMNANSGGSESGYNYCPNVGSSSKGFYNMGTASNGSGEGHTHTLSSHTHSIPAHTHNVSTVYVFAWKRTA